MQSAIQKVTRNKNLSSEEMTRVMNITMSGNATDSQIAALLIGLNMKGETVDEVTAAATVMRELSSKVEVSKPNLIDTCGTGGDSLGTFNISTACCFVSAAAGAHVGKHGNRSISSNSGSADLLEKAGVNLNLSAKEVSQCIEEIGVGFLYTINHHSAMKHVMKPRKEIAIRTIFNVLGPLTNPANAPNQVVGVFNKRWIGLLADVLQRLESRHVMVVHADDGLDEISIASHTTIAELKDNHIKTFTIHPHDFGMKVADLKTIRAKNSTESLAIINSVFDNTDGPAKDIVCLNSGAAIYVSGLVNSLEEGISKARKVIADGSAKQKLNAFIQYTNRF